MKSEKSLIKKSMTKKQLKEYYSSQRSTFSSGMNLGGKVMRSPKDYNRQEAKREIRRDC